MGLDIDALAKDMEKLLNNIIIQEKIESLNILKEDLAIKKKLVGNFIYSFNKLKMGKISKKLLDDLEIIEADFNQLYENFDDKLMIFIIGNGNVGKSTLLNSLVGYSIAETDFRPNTWKIDTYSPNIEKSKAVIKYKDGNKKCLSLKDVKDIVKEDEEKSKNAKKAYKASESKEMKTLKTKEERAEMKKYLADKYLHKSNISEVVWPVEKNWMLEKCLLVDTPGLNQNLHDLEQLGSIKDYYHKADGVLWLLDGQTIAAENTNNLFNELSDVLESVGGVRDNIIGVINRMDLIRENGGEDAVIKVKNSAKKIFGDKFHNIVGISAQEAFECISKGITEDIDKSGILDLQNAIRDIFISKSEVIKNSAKEQGNNRLTDIILGQIDGFYNNINKYENMYIEKEQKLIALEDEFVENLEIEIQSFFKSYLDEVAWRVDFHIDSLAEGQREDFVKNTMYKIDEFVIRRDEFIKNKELEIENNFYTWEKLSRISEYKYISNKDLVSREKVVFKEELVFSSLKNIEYFTPSYEDDIFSLLGNFFGKGMFMFRKGGIKRKINLTIKEACERMAQDILSGLYKRIDNNFAHCINVLNSTFSDVMFNFDDIDTIKSRIECFRDEITKEKEDIKLKDIVL